MELTNLATRPDKLMDTIDLIERCFQYSPQNSFQEDFFPLVEKRNLENCWILISEEDQVIAHSGCMIRKLAVGNADINVLLIGGVAVDESHRGKGYSSKILNHILKKYSDVALQILWSDKVQMYKKLGFFPCIDLYEVSKTSGVSSFYETTLAKLSDRELECIQQLYQNSNDFRLRRTLEDWRILADIKSSKLFIKASHQEITNYFFINKGQDLQGVIHEFAHLSDLDEMRTFGKIWSPTKLEDSINLFGCLARIGQHQQFKRAIRLLTNEKIEVFSIKENIGFKFQTDNYELDTEEFLQGVLGPNRFEELKDLSPIYISGLDSI